MYVLVLKVMVNTIGFENYAKILNVAQNVCVHYRCITEIKKLVLAIAFFFNVKKILKKIE